MASGVLARHPITSRSEPAVVGMINELWRCLVKSRRIALLLAATLIAAPPAVAKPAQGNVTSYWAGTTQARCGAMVSDNTRCNALQNITLTLIQDGTKISGAYTCAYGNQNCRGFQQTGTIVDGSLNGNQLAIAVQTPNRTTCRFTGLLSDDSGRGAYTCKGGSRPVERGSWKIHRTSTARPAASPHLPSLLRPSRG
jgi:hypothetical protein